MNEHSEKTLVCSSFPAALWIRAVMAEVGVSDFVRTGCMVRFCKNWLHTIMEW